MNEDGFANVASYFSSDRDRSSTVFRRFDQLALRNLLYLQGRLASLEAKQATLDLEDRMKGDLDALKAGTSWEDFEKLAYTGHEKERMALAVEIQEVLKLYYDGLLQYSRIAGLDEPPETTLKAFRRYFHRSPGQTRLRNESSTILDDEHDLATLHGSTDRDRLTSFVLNHMGWALAIKSGDSAVVKAKTLSRVVSGISTVMVAILLVGAVATLNYTGSQLHMAVLAIFAASFAGAVALLTNASRAEVFSASCAYVAVLVVFLGTSGNSSPP